jgi:hypothetical protein
MKGVAYDAELIALTFDKSNWAWFSFIRIEICAATAATCSDLNQHHSSPQVTDDSHWERYAICCYMCKVLRPPDHVQQTEVVPK